MVKAAGTIRLLWPSFVLGNLVRILGPAGWRLLLWTQEDLHTSDLMLVEQVRMHW